MGGDETAVPARAPSSTRTFVAATGNPPKEVSNRNSGGEIAAIHRLRTPHGALVAVLSARQKSLSAVRLLWPRENLRAALESAILMQDQAVFVDILRVLLSYRCACYKYCSRCFLYLLKHLVQRQASNLILFT